ncbi:MAG TPA: pyocin knob domain-containing protein [Candidatus Gallimonas gallistercoris]|uniref:Pyocin knob domain-containing protein n=1 Tax=Candidatus Gallimonas gallistercoris TaxID=2838602 RepID=A0A9D2KGI1_9FIRM|nr:pyocin knob domain-containing protein [Candidatus Gallimonas gallistercoris]
MAQQTILIRVRGKRAETDFSELVSFNENSYRLQFDFDGEWADYSQRVAVVLWAGGCREQLFTGTSCDMPAVLSPDCDTALVGVYSADGAGGRIASSFVRLRCLAGAYCEGEESPPASLHEQILEFLNKYDLSAFEQKVTSGTYSAVDVNAYGFVTGGKQIVEVGEEGQTTPSASLADGGIFIKRTAGGDTLCYYADGVLTPVTSGGGGGEGTVTSVNGQTGDVTISKNDLGLAVVALTGSYNDLQDTPEEGAVTSVNGQTGDVTISKNDLGLAVVALTGSYNDLLDKPVSTGEDDESAVTSVNGQTGDVTISKFDLGLAQVALTGSYNDLADKPTFAGTAVTSVNGQTGDVTISKNDLGLAVVALTGSYNDLLDKPVLTGGDDESAVTSVNGQTGDVTISKFDLGLAQVALTGSYNDLADKPTFTGGGGAVTSVNGQTGDVTISKNDLGLGLLDNERQLPISSVVWYGGNFNTLDDTGCYYVEGSSDLPCYNAPTSNKNSASSCRWFLLTMSHADEGNNITQVAFSLMSDCAIRIRNYSGGSWCAWKTVI